MTDYYAALVVGTTGNNHHDLLGTDEENIVLFAINLIRAEDGQSIWSDSFVLDHTPFDDPVLNPETTPPHNQNQNQNQNQTEQNNNLNNWKNELGISDESNTKSLATVIQIVEDNLPSGSVTMVTDGAYPLRQVLQVEASNSDLSLPSYYYNFIDIRKVTKATDSILIHAQELKLKHHNKITAISEIITDFIQRGESLGIPEIIMAKLEPGICSSTELIDTGSVVRARGLPWQSSDQDVAKFFRGLNIAKGGVALCLSPQGRRNGEALVRFENQEQRDMALKRHKHHIGSRYIEVYKASGEDFIAVAGGCNNEAQAFLSKGGQVIVRMRGLPYDCSNKQVVDFFAGCDSEEVEKEGSCKVLDAEEGVLFVKRPDGRATGDAFVLFADEDDAANALAKHKQSIGARYIELFRSTTAEVQQVLNRCLETKSESHSQQAHPHNNAHPSLGPHPLQHQLPPLLHHQPHHHHHPLSHPHLLSPTTPPMPPSPNNTPQHIITSGTRKDCIRLRGLPYEAQVEHILEFLAEHAKNIVYQGVHMVYNAQGQPSGEAFIQMNSENSAFASAQSKHHRIMVMKKQRYIEVFQCSGDDMNLVLTGGKLATPTSSPQLPPPQLNNQPGGFNGMYHLIQRYQQPLFYYYSPNPTFYQHNHYLGVHPEMKVNDLLTTTTNNNNNNQDKTFHKQFTELGLFIA